MMTRKQRNAEAQRRARAEALGREFLAEQAKLDALIKSSGPLLRAARSPAELVNDEAHLWYLRQLELSLEYRQAQAVGDYSKYRYTLAGNLKVLIPAGE
jgi:hypothetical protein